MSTEFKRPNWDEYFSEIAVATAKRSNCCKRKVGAVLVRDNRIVSCGFNGTPTGIRNCYEGGCGRCNDPTIESGTRLDECVCLHAETNAILECGRPGATGGTIYCTNTCCLSCAKKLIQVGVVRVVCISGYSGISDQRSLALFEEAGVKFEQLKEE